MPEKRTILVGLGGPSSSGKSSVGRILQSVLPNCVIVHQDDFYKPEKDLPVKNGVADWDSVDSLDMDRMGHALEQVKQTGRLPKDFKSVEAEVGKSVPRGVPDDFVEMLRRKVLQDDAFKRLNLAFVLVDGFMLYTCSKHHPSVLDELDLPLLLRATKETLRRRREQRGAYLTADDTYWQDPPHYFDEFVWPGYIDTHRWLFKDGNPDGPLSFKAIEAGIEAPPQVDPSIEINTEFALDAIIRYVDRFNVQ